MFYLFYLFYFNDFERFQCESRESTLNENINDALFQEKKGEKIEQRINYNDRASIEFNGKYDFIFARSTKNTMIARTSTVFQNISFFRSILLFLCIKFSIFVVPFDQSLM